MEEPACLLVYGLRGLGDRELRLLGGVEVHDVGDLAAHDLPVRRLNEAELETVA